MNATLPPPTVPTAYRHAPVSHTRGGTPFVDLSDEFTNWLSFANAGMLNKGNLLCIDHAMAHLPSKHAIVEIGVFCGLSTNLLTYYKRKHHRTNPVFNCDKWVFEGAGGTVGDSSVTHEDYRSFVRETYVRNVRMFSRDDLPHTVEALSDEFFVAWASRKPVADVFGRDATLGGPISFCYIDGNHTYEFATRDFHHTDRFLEPGGFVLFDDSADGSTWEVTRVIEEVKRLGTYQVVAQNPNYLFQKCG